MSLLNSIFGGAPAASAKEQKGSAPDLFGAKVSVPSVMAKKSLSSKKGKKEDDKSNDKDDSGSSDKDKSSDSATQQNTPEEGGDAPTTNTYSAKAKKTKEELKEEESRTIFVGNLPPDITRRALGNIFKPCGQVASARFRSMAVAGVKLPPEQAGNQSMMRKVCANTGKILTDKQTKNSTQGYVVFKSIDSIPAALKLNNTTHQSHTIRVDKADPTVEPSRSVFVGNLPYGADEETLRVHFSEHLSAEEDLNESEGSAVSGVRIIRDKETQKCKGFGYLTLRDATLVPAALQLHGTTYMKRELRVMICGKRFKGNRGDDSAANQKSGRRSFEGQRASGESSSAILNQQPKRKSEERPESGGALRVKRRRARSEKKTAPGGNNKGGMSKRAVTEQKVNKRVKKLQKRAVKGMGKKKN